LETPDTAEVKVVAWSHMPQLSLISLKWFWLPHEMNQGGEGGKEERSGGRVEEWEVGGRRWEMAGRRGRARE